MFVGLDLKLHDSRWEHTASSNSAGKKREDEEEKSSSKPQM